MHMPILQHKNAKAHSTLAQNAGISRCLFQKREQISMYNIQRPVGIPLPNDTGDVDLRSTLRYHFDIDLLIISFDATKRMDCRKGANTHMILSKHAEELTRDTGHILQVLSHQTHDGHVGY